MARDVPLERVFRGVAYFLPAYILCIILMTIFPQVVLFLPGLLK
jgi:TRAP-type C4-dicarboxylate transport system permease large subunit